MTLADMRDFRQYLKQCTDAQVQGVYDKEKKALRHIYAELACAQEPSGGVSSSTSSRVGACVARRHARTLNLEMRVTFV